MKAGEYIVGVEKKQLEYTQMVQISNWRVSKYLTNFASETKFHKKFYKLFRWICFRPYFWQLNGMSFTHGSKIQNRVKYYLCAD